jgi:hypothetical protein
LLSNILLIISTSVACPPGTYSDGVVSYCTECKSGYYQKLSGQSTCKQCPPGTTTTGTGSTECARVPM